MDIIIFIICFAASSIGAICGIGGGVIIKPVLDALGAASVSTVSFLSGLTVLSMTVYSVARSKLSGSSAIEGRTGTPLAVGAAVGGVAGKELFSQIASRAASLSTVGTVQAVCLLIITLGTLIYTLFKSRIHTRRIDSPPLCAAVGLLLGIMSSFLGIGGGPINLVVLFYFFSMETKQAAENSLYIILFSQIASLLYSLVKGTVPAFSWVMLAVMIPGGILGGIFGRWINKKIASETVDKLFIALMCVIICINIYNIAAFSAAA